MQFSCHLEVVAFSQESVRNGTTPLIARPIWSSSRTDLAKSQQVSQGPEIALQTGVKLLLCITGLTTASLLSGQDQSNSKPAPPLTLEVALSLAEQFNPRLQVANAQIQVADAGIVTARTRPNPEANFLGGQQSLRLPGASTGLLQHWGYSQLIESRTVRRNRTEAANFGKEASLISLEESKLHLRGAVKQAFYEVLRRRNEIELAREALKLVEDLRQRVEVQVRVGEAARLELTRAQSEVSTAQTYLRSAQLRERAAVAELRALIGSNLSEELAPAGDLEAATVLPDLDEVRKRALTMHPAIARAGAEIRRVNANVETEKSLRRPQPTFIAEYEQMPDLRFFRAGVSVPVPFFNRRQGPIAEATAALSQARSIATAVQLEISSAVERAFSAYQIASQQVLAFESGSLLGAQAAVEGAEAAFRFGERGIIEVLDAQRVLRSIRLDFLNAKYDRQAALIELEQLKAIDPAPTSGSSTNQIPGGRNND